MSKCDMDRRYPGYSSCHGAIRRCHCPTDSRFGDYGGRGIQVFAPWRRSALTMWRGVVAEIGERPFKGAHLDRIDNDRGYEPGNIRWVSARVNQWNRRDTLYVVHNGERIGLSRAMDREGFPAALVATIQHRCGLCGFGTDEGAQKLFDRYLSEWLSGEPVSLGMFGVVVRR